MFQKERPFEPNWTSPPGESIADYMEHFKMSKAAFAFAMNLNMEAVDDLLRGKLLVDDEIAEKLVHVFGRFNVQFWKNREANYVADLKRLGLTRPD